MCGWINNDRLLNFRWTVYVSFRGKNNQHWLARVFGAHQTSLEFVHCLLWLCVWQRCVCVCVCALCDLKYFPVTMTIVLAEGSENNHLWVASLAVEVCAASENNCATILYIFFLNEQALHKKLISFSERPQQHKIRRTVVHCFFYRREPIKKTTMNWHFWICTAQFILFTVT